MQPNHPRRIPGGCFRLLSVQTHPAVHASLVCTVCPYLPEGKVKAPTAGVRALAVEDLYFVYVSCCQWVVPFRADLIETKRRTTVKRPPRNQTLLLLHALPVRCILSLCSHRHTSIHTYHNRRAGELKIGIQM
jgi:hypothetical protein